MTKPPIDGKRGDVSDGSAQGICSRQLFLSRGETDITDERERKIGTLDLHGMFQSGVTVQSFSDGLTSYSGKFRAFSNTWLVFNGGDQEIGTLKAKFTFFYQTVCI